MLPFLCLVILCGVLTQNAQGYDNPLAIASLSPQLLQQLISHRMNTQELKDRLQGLPLEDVIKKGAREGNRGGGFLSGIPLLGGLLNNVIGNILGVKINNVELLKLNIGFDEREAKIIVTIPADIELELKLPLNLFSRLLHLKLYLDIQVGVRVDRDPSTGHVRLIIGNCHNTPGHLRITVLDNANFVVRTVNNVVKLVTDVLEKTLPHLLQKELCPLVNGVVQNVLDLLQGAFNSEMHGERVQFLPESFDVHDGSFNLAYQGLMQRPGGQREVIRPDSVPLSAVPLEGSSMNMVLSSNYLSSAVRALLPPQSFNFDIASQGEGAAFRQQIAAVLPEASNVRMLQIASGVPSLSLTVGKIQLWQQIKIRFFTEHLTRDYRPLFILRATVAFTVHPSVIDGKMILALHSVRIQNLQLVNSDRHFDVQRMANLIAQLVSTSLLPHQNKSLAVGIPLPLVQNLGLRSLHVTVGKDAVMIVPSGEVPVSA
ncbi:BPI fold-containing family B member 1-like [Eublepharis macularius]|uniref:BPI fold-containing family B member 1-like n=1 Tax=Eublepharis macularius TaxID=481883 RepID=A0AA97JEN3_EUBMA|nr:BPI fold-containing family B member 1-like [Eublepharis macularius]